MIPKHNFAYDTSKCPLCGEANHCALAADPSATECWCGSEEFPRELLTQILEEAVRKTCVCQKCLEKYQGSVNTADKSS